MSSLLKTSSWVIVNKDTKKAEMEVFDEETAQALTIYNDEFVAVPILEYLQKLNKTIRGQ